jgi:hypothetical protein
MSISILTILAVCFGLAGLISFVAGIRALARRRALRFTMQTLLGLLLVVAGLLLATLGVATRGYQALTHEAVAATVSVQPGTAHQFTAEVQFPDGRRGRFVLAGDQIYVDAHILKWKPLANILGLHTAYELDRVAGRYLDLAQERIGPRTVFSLAEEKPVNLFRLRQRYTLLSPLLDVEYGSATFAPAGRRARYEVRVSTTGLLVREIPSTP